MKLKEIKVLNYCIGEDLAFCKKYVGYWHNSDGPAYMTSCKYKEWWLNGKYIKDNWNET